MLCRVVLMLSELDGITTVILLNLFAWSCLFCYPAWYRRLLATLWVELLAAAASSGIHMTGSWSCAGQWDTDLGSQTS